MPTIAPLPLFSVLIPSYNRPELLVQTIESVLAQSMADLEVIVSDDASPRGSEIASAAGRFANDPRFQFVLQPRNLGWSDNRNALLAAARGEFVLLLGDDDLLPAHALGRLAEHLRSNPDRDLIVFGYEVIDFEGRHCYRRHVPATLTLQVGHGEVWREVFLYDVLPMWAFHPFTLCCRRNRAVAWGYDKRCGIGDDAFFLFRALDSGSRIDVLPDVLFSWRRALTDEKGYINLSSGNAAIDQGRRLIWLLAQQTTWSKPAVKELIGSAEFARHFLGLPRGIADKVAALGRLGTPAALEEAKACWEKLPPTRRWRIGNLCKLNSLRRIGGIRYAYFGFQAALKRSRGRLR